MKKSLGLDLLRIFSMLGIIMLHVLGRGGVLTSSQGVGFYINNFLEIICYSSVDIFALLSGYLSINKKRSFNRAIELILITVFWSIIITLIFLFFKQSIFVSWKDYFKGLFPPIIGRYWYITCFIPILVFEPFINKAINSLTIKEHGIIAGASLFLFSVIPSLVITDFFGFENGYCFVWLLTLYIVGAFVRRKDINLGKILSIIVLALIPFVLLFGNMFIDKLFGGRHYYMVSYISPLIVLFSILCLLLFKNIDSQTNVIASSMSKMSFDVYIVHCHVFIYDFLLYNAFIWITDLKIVLQPFVSLGIGVAIFIFCFILGLLRNFLFKVCGINKIIDNICNKVTIFDAKEKQI